VNEQRLPKRIAMNPKVMVGKPVIRGTRLTVEHILNLLAHGASPEDVQTEYPGLKAEDIQACLLLAARSLESLAFVPSGVE